MWDMTHSYVRHDSLICVPWLICVSWLIHVWESCPKHAWVVSLIWSEQVLVTQVMCSWMTNLKRTHSGDRGHSYNGRKFVCYQGLIWQDRVLVTLKWREKDLEEGDTVIMDASRVLSMNCMKRTGSGDTQIKYTTSSEHVLEEGDIVVFYQWLI